MPTIWIVSHDGSPIEGAEVALLEPDSGYRRRSDQNGIVALPHGLPARFAMVVDAPNHHPGFFDQIPPNQSLCLDPLPPPEQHLGWWHHLIQLRSHDPKRGAGIRIGVIDTGCSSRLPQLDHVQRRGAFRDMQSDETDLGLDWFGHGSAVLGLIGSRPTEDCHFAGIAPGAEIISVKLFDHRSPELSTDSQAEVQEAVEYLAGEGVHLINCSFECDEGGPATEQSFQVAYDLGVICLCAAGNHGGSVSFPARSSWVAAVGALGDSRQLPKSSYLRATFPSRDDAKLWKDPLFIPGFTARGKELVCTAPGVGVFAVSLPTDEHPDACRAVKGTSFATPIVCGLLAAELGRDSHYRSLPADKNRADYARSRLNLMCQDLGFSQELQGNGLPVFHDRPNA